MIETVNGTVEVLNPAEILRNQDGIFEVTSPYGRPCISSDMPTWSKDERSRNQ